MGGAAPGPEEPERASSVPAGAQVLQGGAGGSAASGGSDGNEERCQELDRRRFEALAAARVCELLGNDLEECVPHSTIADHCNCGRLVNAQRPDLVEAAQQARDAWSAECDGPEECGDCPPPDPTLPTCGNDGDGGGICTY